MKEWSSPTSHCVETTFRSIPVGRGGTGGTAPFSIDSVQSASDFSVAVLPMPVMVEYMFVPRTPTPKRHSHAAMSLWASSGLLAKTCAVSRVNWLPSWWQKLQPDFKRLIHSSWLFMAPFKPLPLGAVSDFSPVPGKRFLAGGASNDSQ